MTKPKRVREPLQVYLEHHERDVLERVVENTGWSRAETLRRGLRSIAAEVLVEDSAALAFLDLAATGAADAPVDVAVNHDAYLAEMDSWSPAQPRKPRKRKAK